MKLLITCITLVLTITFSQAQTPADKKSSPIITIAELFANKNNYANKTVKIKGEVKKYNSKIMSKNWIHLQDGTEHSGENDLTITSQMEVKTGDIVTFEGKIILDKDFGSGYFYKIIMEDGKVVEQATQK
ncbi:MAG: hypothetical protein L3J06_06275 [Cyclobacteriaceae bacterium]|nr:hypothetical protein [Cyclobacteriaceae bacterium]